MEYKLEELTKRVDKHNNVVERTYSLEQKAVVQEEQIKVANHRISDLEEKENGQTAVGVIGAGSVISAVDWKMVASAAVVAGVVSILTSVAGIPEVEAKEGE